MSRFLQLHLLTFFPPANLNRDDTGRPKTAVVGGATRLRLSSQALKRAWRKSDVFKAALEGHLGDRTKRLGRNIKLLLVNDHGVSDSEAHGIAKVISAVFGKPENSPEPGKELFIKQLAFISPDEQRKVSVFLDRVLSEPEARKRLLTAATEVDLDANGEEPAGEDDAPTKGKKAKAPKQSKQTTKLINDMRQEILSAADTAADIALFGRMLAESPDYNREAAAQVAHAITTHKVIVEDDFYTAMDDLNLPTGNAILNLPADDAGAGFLDEAAFGSGVFYLYLCVDRVLLLKNLGGDAALAATALGALAEAAATVAPRGKQNSFAAHSRAHYVLAEAGNKQPRTLAGAFAKPVTGNDLKPGANDLMADSIAALEKFRAALEVAYGPGSDLPPARMEVGVGGSLAEIVTFCRG